MFEKLDEYIKSSGDDIGYLWDNIGVLEASFFYKEFKEEDWNKLFQAIPIETLIWKIKVASSVTGEEDKVIKTASLMHNTDNIILLDRIIRILDYYDYNIYEDKFNLFPKENKVEFIKNIRNSLKNLEKEKVDENYYDIKIFKKYLDNDNIKEKHL